MFERFTDRARRVVVLAQEEARLLNHNYIGTEHLLLGLIHEGEGLGARALESLGVSLNVVRGRVEERIGLGTTKPMGHIPFTPRAKKSLELALRESVKLGHNYIGTEHILLGLLREGEGVACVVLAGLGADTARIESKLGEDMFMSTAQAAGGETATSAAIAPGAHDLPPEIRALDERLADLRRKKNDAIERADWETATRVREEEKALMRERDDRERAWHRALSSATESLTMQAVTVEQAVAQAAQPITEPGPHCAHCRSPLAQTVAYRIIQVSEDDGDGKAPVLFVFCRTCGTTIDSLIAPDES